MLKFFLLYVMAWIAVFIALFLVVKYFFRRAAQSAEGTKKSTLIKVNKSLKWPHIILGFVLIGVGLIHGLNSPQAVLSLNTGTFVWVLTILLALVWMLKKKFAAGKWRLYHNILTILFIAILVWHVVDMGGIRIFRVYDVLQKVEQMENSNGQSDFNRNPNNLPNQTNSAEPNGQSYGNGNGNGYGAGNGQGNGAGRGQNNRNPANCSNLPTENTSAIAGETKPSGDRKTLVKPALAATDNPLDKYYFAFAGLDLKDGEYDVSAVGYSPGLEVKVTIKDDKVSEIAIPAHHEKDAKYYTAPLEKIPAEIVAAQTLDVDIVTGATMTSMGIIDGVRQAVIKAAGK